MLKKLLIATVASGFAVALTLPVPVSAAEAGMTCKEAAKLKYPGDRKMRHAYKKACKEASKATQS
jgi:hypothetical protein